MRYEIVVYPEPHDDPELGADNYYWIVYFVSDEGTRSNSGFGWVDSLEKAWNEALSYYREYLSMVQQ